MATLCERTADGETISSSTFDSVERIDDRFAPEGRAVDAALVDPEADAGGPQSCGEIENAVLVVARIAQENVC